MAKCLVFFIFLGVYISLFKDSNSCDVCEAEESLSSIEDSVRDGEDILNQMRMFVHKQRMTLAKIKIAQTKPPKKVKVKTKEENEKPDRQTKNKQAENEKPEKKETDNKQLVVKSKTAETEEKKEPKLAEAKK